MKRPRFPYFPLFPCFLFFCSACVFSPIHDLPGSITFTANDDCEIRLFTTDSVQIAREYYELGKAPFIVPMKEPGEYMIIAVRAGLALAPKTVKEPILYPGGKFEYYIEF